MKSRIILAAMLAASAAGCVTAPRFEYGSYENTLYAYYKNPANRAAFERSLIDAIEKGEKNGRLAPGLYAELGYLRLDDGDTQAAFGFFQKEMAAFPEAEPFMTKILDRLSAPAEQSTINSEALK